MGHPNSIAVHVEIPNAVGENADPNYTRAIPIACHRNRTVQSIAKIRIQCVSCCAVHMPLPLYQCTMPIKEDRNFVRQSACSTYNINRSTFGSETLPAASFA